MREMLKEAEPSYLGVLFEKQGFRVAVSPRGADYLLQEFVESSRLWETLARVPNRVFLGVEVEDTPGCEPLAELVDGLPLDPWECGSVPYRGGKRSVPRALKARSARPARPERAASEPGGFRPARPARPAREARPARGQLDPKA